MKRKRRGFNAQKIRNKVKGAKALDTKDEKERVICAQETRSVKRERIRRYGPGGVDALEIRSVMKLQAHTKKRKGKIITLESKSVKFDRTLSIYEKEKKGSQGTGNMKRDGSLGIDKEEERGLRRWE